MRRGDLYRVRRVDGDPKKARVVVLVSRQASIDSRFATAICAPVYTHGADLATQVSIGPAEGLKHPSWIMCDNLVSVPKRRLTDYVASLSPSKLDALADALAIALDLGR